MIYFIQAGENGPIKIGVAIDVASRMSFLQSGNAEKLRLIGTMPGSYDEEKCLHRLAWKDRIRGEWFHPTHLTMAVVAAALDGDLVLEPQQKASAIKPAKGVPGASQMIAALGGQSAVARKLGIPLTTVNGWNTKDLLPNWRVEVIAELFEAEGIELPQALAGSRVAA